MRRFQYLPGSVEELERTESDAGHREPTIFARCQHSWELAGWVEVEWDDGPGDRIVHPVFS